jgi:uncharacterized protein YrrD
MYNRIPSQKLVGNPIINIATGEQIAEVSDVQINPESLSAAAAITSKGSLLKRELRAIRAAEIEVWGPDAILAGQTDVVVGEEELDDRESWLSASDDIQGYQVVAEDGTAIGTLGDVVLDNQGAIAGYEMASVDTEGRVAAANWIDAKATRALGPDVLVVKSEYV